LLKECFEVNLYIKQVKLIYAAEETHTSQQSTSPKCVTTWANIFVI